MGFITLIEDITKVRQNQEKQQQNNIQKMNKFLQELSPYTYIDSSNPKHLYITLRKRKEIIPTGDYVKDLLLQAKIDSEPCYTTEFKNLIEQYFSFSWCTNNTYEFSHYKLNVMMHVRLETDLNFDS